jgi:ribosomal protein L37AE/L43A
MDYDKMKALSEVNWKENKRCPNCGEKSQTYLQIKTGLRICRQCGDKWVPNAKPSQAERG